jgi:hypothetical protein
MNHVKANAGASCLRLDPTDHLGVVLVLALLSCAHVPPAPDGALECAGLERLYCVEHNGRGDCSIYRSAQPTAAQFACLVSKYGLRSVVKLNTRWPGDGGSDVLPPGVELIHHPWWPAGPVTSEAISTTLEDLDEADKPVLIHCAHGEDRTGLLVGLHRVRRGIWAAAAWNEMLAYGFHASLFGLVETYERETEWRVPK